MRISKMGLIIIAGFLILIAGADHASRPRLHQYHHSLDQVAPSLKSNTQVEV